MSVTAMTIVVSILTLSVLCLVWALIVCNHLAEVRRQVLLDRIVEQQEHVCRLAAVICDLRGRPDEDGTDVFDAMARHNVISLYGRQHDATVISLSAGGGLMK